MRRVLIKALTSAALATAAIGFATPASATDPAVFADQNGPDLTTAIHASTTNTQNDQAIVYACTQNDGRCANTYFEGLTSNTSVTEAIHITDGAGFAAITDAGSGNLYNLIMNPTPNFTDYEFSVQLVNDGAVSIYYLLVGGGGCVLANGSPIDQMANQEDH